MLPYLVTSNEDSAALLELDDGRFQLLEEGPVGAFSFGYQYLLVEKPLAKYLQSLLVAQVTFTPAVVLNRLSGEEHRTHTRVHVLQSFRPDEIATLQLEGNRLLSMNHEYFFVSPSLRQALEDGGFKYLQFSEGLSGFASAA